MVRNIKHGLDSNEKFLISLPDPEVGADENVVNVAEEVRSGMCTGGIHLNAYVQKKRAPTSMCQPHCEKCRQIHDFKHFH